MAKRKRRKPTAPDVVDRATDGLTDALATLATLRRAASTLAELANVGARVARTQLVERAASAARAAGDEALRAVDDRKAVAADRVDRVASAAHQTAHVLRAAKFGAVGGYVEQAAAAMDGVTDYLQEGDVRQVIEDAADLARRHPALAAASVIVAGLVLGRFVAAGGGRAAVAAAVPLALGRSSGGGSRATSGNGTVRVKAKRARGKSASR